jgi:hypothetical protein
LVEKPLFTLFSTAASIERDVLAKVKVLSKDQQRQYLSLHNNFRGQNIFSGIYRTNALPCGPDSPVGAVYPTICLINHSCAPDSHNSWKSGTMCETIHALRDIKAEEEITISYAKLQASALRRAHLKDAFGFDCRCSLCSLPASELQNSDARRCRIERLDETIGDTTRVLNVPIKALADCQELI